MKKLLKEISVIPGVTGSCIFDKKDGALCKDMNANLATDLLEDVGIHLVRLIQMGAMSDLNVKSAHFRFDKYTVVGMPFQSGAVLLTICDANANCSLVATTAAMLAADMRDELEVGSVTVPENVIEDDEPEELDALDLDDADEPIVETVQKPDRDLQPMLDKIEQALAGAIGPVAGMVMQDYIDKWQQAGPDIPARLSELASMLTEEIGDRKMADEFIAKVENILKVA